MSDTDMKRVLDALIQNDEEYDDLTVAIAMLAVMSAFDEN